LALIVSLAVAGCGGGSGGSSSGSATGDEMTPAEFAEEVGKNELLEFGTEASAAEREAAGAVLAKSFRARAGADFKAQCQTLSGKAVQQVKFVAHAEGGIEDCIGGLEELASPLSKTKGVREDRLGGPILLFRVKGGRGFAFFHGTDGKNWVIPLEREAGIWKVAVLSEEELKPETSPPKSEKSQKTVGKSG